MEWKIQDELYPSPLDRIPIQIAIIGAGLLKALGMKVNPETLLCMPGMANRTVTPEQLRNKLLMVFGGLKGRQDKTRAARANGSNQPSQGKAQ